MIEPHSLQLLVCMVFLLCEPLGRLRVVTDPRWFPLFHPSAFDGKCPCFRDRCAHAGRTMRCPIHVVQFDDTDAVLRCDVLFSIAGMIIKTQLESVIRTSLSYTDVGCSCENSPVLDPSSRGLSNPCKGTCTEPRSSSFLWKAQNQLRYICSRYDPLTAALTLTSAEKTTQQGAWCSKTWAFSSAHKG